MTLPNVPDSVRANRLVALYCAMRTVPDSVVADGAANAGEITTPARIFEDWIGEAVDEQDRITRRGILLMICDHTPEGTPVKRVRALARELHHYVTR